jgi:predicted HNH restriction endonuclease
MSQVIRVSAEVYARLESHVRGFDTPTGVIERLLDYYEGVEHDDTENPSQKKLEKDMNRKQFVQSVGATCRNWTWSWSFINEEERFILFGAWDNLKDENGLLILSKEWEVGAKGRKLPGYKQSLEHLQLIEEEGYTLKTYMMYGENGGSEAARITSIETYTTDRILKRVDDRWYAV